MNGTKEFQTYERAMRQPPGSRSSRRETPRRCKECEFHQPRWKYRSCYYVRCPFELKESTLRETPLRNAPFRPKEVKLNGV